MAKIGFFLFFFFNLFIYLAAPAVSCDTWDLLVVASGLLVAACGI